jgi:hypothetical protein
MPSPPKESRLIAFLRGFLILAMVPLAGCTLGASKQAAVPPPPKPAAVQPPAPDPPLSIPQTAVTLPSPQPVNPDAIPVVQAAQAPAPPKTDTPPAPKVARRTAAGPPKPDPEPEADSPPTVAAPEQAPIQPILNGDEQKRIQAAMEARKREIAEKLARAKEARRLSSHDQSLVERIQSFLAQCAQAEGRGDYSQADTLSERALVLARELQRE